MEFEWDEQKNRVNIQKHGLDFADAADLFASPMLISLDEREEYDEDRWIGLGMLKTRVIVVVYTERDEDTIRIISLRKALRHERERYEQALRDGLGTY
jgi:uncharacterized DUF497 family protein